MNEQEARELLKKLSEANSRGPDHIGMTEEVVVIKTPAKKEEEKK